MGDDDEGGLLIAQASEVFTAEDKSNFHRLPIKRDQYLTSIAFTRGRDVFDVGPRISPSPRGDRTGFAFLPYIYFLIVSGYGE